MLQLLGHFDKVPCDSETVRHLRKVHKLSVCTQANVRELAQQVSLLPSILKGKERDTAEQKTEQRTEQDRTRQDKREQN